MGYGQYVTADNNCEPFLICSHLLALEIANTETNMARPVFDKERHSQDSSFCLTWGAIGKQIIPS